MSVIDAVVSAAAILFAVTTAVAPRTGGSAAPLVLPPLAIGCAAQAALEEFSRLFVPIYLLVAATVAVAVSQRHAAARRGPLAAIARFCLGLLAAAAVVVWAVPVSNLPDHTGRPTVNSSHQAASPETAARAVPRTAGAAVTAARSPG